MPIINELIELLLYALPSMALLRGLYCIVKIVTDSDQESLYKRRLKNLLWFTGIAETITGLLWVVFGYIY